MANEMTQYQATETQIMAARDRMIAECASGLDGQRQVDLLLSLTRADQKLLSCGPGEIMRAAVQAWRKGLSLNPALQHCHLIPYGSKIEVVPGYRGLIHLMTSKGGLKEVRAHSVRKNDRFEYNFWTETITHLPPSDGVRGEVLGAYAYGVYHDDTRTAPRMVWKDELDLLASRSRGSVWKDNPAPMARKTAIRRLANFVQLPEDVAELIGTEDIIEGREAREYHATVVASHPAQLTQADAPSGMDVASMPTGRKRMSDLGGGAT